MQHYVQKLCQAAILAPERLVEILEEIDGEDVLTYRNRMLNSALPAPDQSAAFVSRAYVAGVCTVDDLAPEALARQVQKPITTGLTRHWPADTPTTSQITQMLNRIEEHALLVQACRGGHRRRS